jgi:DNA-binding response OmpR family regulator
MRPKKVLLLILNSQQRLSELTFILTTRGYSVRGFTHPSHALDFINQPSLTYDLLLADFELGNKQKPYPGDTLILASKSEHLERPAILFYPENQAPEDHHADNLLVENISIATLLDRVEVLTARKRGPRKGSVRIQPCSVNLSVNCSARVPAHA